MTRAAVYRMRSASGELLYVGCSATPFRRAHQHSIRCDWAGEVAQVCVEWFPSKAEALQKEREAIEQENPANNSRFNGPDAQRQRRSAPQQRGCGVDNSQILARITSLIEQTGESRSSFGKRVANDFGLIPRLETGTDLRASTRAKIEAALTDIQGRAAS